MNDNQAETYWAAFGLASKAMQITCAILFGYWGYRLFMSGVYEQQGELTGKFHGAELSVRQFGPGLGFALIAVAFGFFAVWKRVEVTTTKGQIDEETPAITEMK